MTRGKKLTICVVAGILVLGASRIKVVDTQNLTIERLENRKGTELIIERCTGTVLNASNGDGAIDFLPENCNYINYNCVKNVKNGDKILTFFVYNPKGNASDDIITRFDFVMKGE